MSMPGCDTQGCYRVQLLGCSVGWRGVHHADGFQSVGRSPVENRAGSAVIGMLLLESPTAVVGVVDLLADSAGRKERFISVMPRCLNVAVLGQHISCGGEDLVSAF